jgi:KRAB domain-containing zinc finger protein
LLLSEQEARESFHEVIQRQVCGGLSTGKLETVSGFETDQTSSTWTGEVTSIEETKMFKCSSCEHNSNVKSDLIKHISDVHPMGHVVTVSNGAGLTEGGHKTSKPIDSGREMVMSSDSTEKQKVWQTVARQKLKRLCCTVCPYRSNFRSDVSRHIRHKHPGSTARVGMLSSAEAAITLTDYLTTWARRKLVAISPNPNSDARQQPNSAVVEKTELPMAGRNPEKVSAVTQELSSAHRAPLENLTEDADGFEYVDGEDENLPWKCAACDFTDPGKQAVVEHWQRHHCPAGILTVGKIEDGNGVTDVQSMLITADSQDKMELSSVDLSCDTAKTTMTTTTSVIKGDWMTKTCESPMENVNRSRGSGVIGEDKPSNEATSTEQKVKKVRNHQVGDKVCDVCPYRTNKLGLLTIHKTYHRPQTKNAYKCPHCPYYVCAPRLLHQHIRIHVGTDVAAGIMPRNLREKKPSAGDIRVVSSFVNVAMSRPELKCLWCPYVGTNRNDILYHRQFHRMRPAAPFKCDHCPYWVSQKRLLKQHSRVHDQQQTLSAPGCVKVVEEFKKVDSQQQLMTTSVELENDLVKSGCDLSLDQKKSVSPLAKNQISNSHYEKNPGNHQMAREPTEPTGHKNVTLESEENMVRTKEGLEELVEEDGSCGSSAEDETDDIQHRSVKSAVQRRRRVGHHTVWRCDQCPYVTAKRSQRDSHRLLHGSQQRHTCNVCNYSVSGLHLLLQHVKLHPQHHFKTTSNKNQKESRSPAKLSRNDKTAPAQPTVHSGDGQKVEKSPGMTPVHNVTTGTKTIYRCDRCPYSNARRDHLLCHARFHSGSGPLVCPHCDYSVSKVHLLTQHIRVHSLDSQQHAALSKSSPDCCTVPVPAGPQDLIASEQPVQIVDSPQEECSVGKNKKIRYMHSLDLQTAQNDEQMNRSDSL